MYFILKPIWLIEIKDILEFIIIKLLIFILETLNWINYIYIY